MGIDIKKEKMYMNLEYDLICEYIKIRKDSKMTQQELAESTNIIRTTVARIESGANSPHLKTMLELLEPLGYTLKIVPIDKDND